MNPTIASETEPIEIQEHEAGAIEDRSLPAEQILSEPGDQGSRPGLFIP
jgi:hypothetical protein